MGFRGTAYLALKRQAIQISPFQGEVPDGIAWHLAAPFWHLLEGLYARHALAKLLGKRDNDALRPADVG